jgi:shikimate 5-dehydrogenase
MTVDKGANLVILNRDADKAKRLAHKINVHFKETRQVVRAGGEELIAGEVINADAVVNVSTKGAAGRFEEYYPLAAARPDNLLSNITKSRELLRLIPKTTILSDVVLRDGGTPFLKAAKEKGYKTLDGIPMVVYQGLEAIWLLHGSELEKNGVTKKQVADVMKQAAGY